MSTLRSASCGLRRASRIGAVLSVLLLARPSLAAASCPSAPEILSRLNGLALERGARTARFAAPPPTALYAKAAAKIGQPFVDRKGQQGFGVIVAELPVASIWKAINDEEHHAIEGGYIPVLHSEVIDGTPRGTRRLLFQYSQRMGLGRWWVSRVWMNPDLYRESGGALWEIIWQSEIDSVDPSRPPVSSISRKLGPIRDSRGAWLLVPLAEECTLVEHFNWCDPGGFVGVAQRLLMTRALRETVGGMVRLAQEHIPLPHPGPPFLKPDGTPLD